jgi:hypothetical protein
VEAILKATGWVLGTLAYALVTGACSSKNGSGFGIDASSGDAPGYVNPSSSGSGTGTATGGGSATRLGTGTGTGVSSQAGNCNVTDVNADNDKDGWSIAEGDCNDCDPNINPGAIDVWHTGDGGAGYWGDEDCSGVAGDSAKPCDSGLSLTDVSAADAAKAIELCATASSSDKKYGVLSAAYVRADGTPFASPGVQVGIESGWGPNVNVQGGQNMLVLSSGTARVAGQQGACGTESCQYYKQANGKYLAGTAPTGFPQNDPDCPPTPAIFDDVALQLQIRVPTNATGYSFSFKFYSFEYPDYVCESQGWNDQFVALVTPPPTGAYVPSGSSAGNVSFDSNNHPVSVNMGYFDVCDPSSSSSFAKGCKSSSTVTCPTLPSPYCPLGAGQLKGTGFDTWSKSPAGATRWLQTQAPATPGSTITVQFTIWDAGNGEYDSTVLIDNFQWNATGGTVTVGTQPIPAPK